MPSQRRLKRSPRKHASRQGAKGHIYLQRWFGYSKLQAPNEFMRAYHTDFSTNAKALANRPEHGLAVIAGIDPFCRIDNVRLRETFSLKCGSFAQLLPSNGRPRPARRWRLGAASGLWHGGPSGNSGSIERTRFRAFADVRELLWWWLLLRDSRPAGNDQKYGAPNAAYRSAALKRLSCPTGIPRK